MFCNLGLGRRFACQPASRCQLRFSTLLPCQPSDQTAQEAPPPHPQGDGGGGGRTKSSFCVICFEYTFFWGRVKLLLSSSAQRQAQGQVSWVPPAGPVTGLPSLLPIPYPQPIAQGSSPSRLQPSKPASYMPGGNLGLSPAICLQ